MSKKFKTKFFQKPKPNLLGNTWSPISKFDGPEWNYTIPDPQERIDFIYYRGAQLQPVDSFLYAGNEPLEPIPRHRLNDYPSDHYALITDFLIKN